MTMLRMLLLALGLTVASAALAGGFSGFNDQYNDFTGACNDGDC